jgi:8-oxo-dGTP diphosphatase
MKEIPNIQTTKEVGETLEFFQSAFSIDNVIFGFDETNLKVLLIKRGTEPYNNYWALPGDLVHPEEDLESAAERILFQLTGVKNVYLEQVHTFGAVKRHPLGRVVTVAYFSLVKIEDFTLIPSSFAQQTKWHSVNEIGELAFDHNQILESCLAALKHKVRIKPIGFELLPPSFSLTKLQHLYEAILEIDLDKRNFRKKMLSTNLLKESKVQQEKVAHRPAKLYEFDQKKYTELKKEGYHFEI